MSKSEKLDTLLGFLGGHANKHFLHHNRRHMEACSMTLALLEQSLNNSLIERENEVRTILLATVAREHCLLVGPPGTAKSHLCRSVAAAIEGLKFFEVTLGPTTDPDHVFGPIDPIEYKNTGRYVHRDENYFTKAHIALLDEFFRGSDAITDAFLRAMGPERETAVDGEQVKLPLISCIGGTNSWPDSQHQQAIFDRWLIRKAVKPVSPQGRNRLLYEELPEVTPQIHITDLHLAHEMSRDLPVAEEAKVALNSILDELFSNGIRPSDRRCRKSLSVARAAAYLDGAAEVQPHHLECLGDVLWDDPNEQPEKCAQIVAQIANPIGAQLTELLREVDQVVSGAKDAAEKMSAIRKLEENEKVAVKLGVSGNGRAHKALAYIRKERVRMQAAALGIDPAKAEALLGGK